jgi:peptidoglycan hydrolase-like protein with peptidoglycan-binding domain
MRQLQLQTPTMPGPDVSDWQTFLTGQGLLQSTVDGDFGPKSDAATRAYQTKAGLLVDGVVGPHTIANAISKGYQSTTGANLAGMDTDVNCSGFAGELAGAGMQFVARYYSDDLEKTLTSAEAQKLCSGGVAIVAVFEDSNDSTSFFSTEIGNSQAAKALQLASAVGQPAGTAIYFAVDFDPALADVQGPISDYFKAIQASLVAAPVQYVAGVYGSGLTCRIIRDGGLARFTWLTGSTGFSEYSSFRTQADLLQLAPERALFNGQLCIDDDIAQSAEFGAFRVAQAQSATAILT